MCRRHVSRNDTRAAPVSGSAARYASARHRPLAAKPVGTPPSSRIAQAFLPRCSPGGVPSTAADRSPAAGSSRKTLATIRRHVPPREPSTCRAATANPLKLSATGPWPRLETRKTLARTGHVNPAGITPALTCTGAQGYLDLLAEDRRRQTDVPQARQSITTSARPRCLVQRLVRQRATDWGRQATSHRQSPVRLRSRIGADIPGANQADGDGGTQAPAIRQQRGNRPALSGWDAS